MERDRPPDRRRFPLGSLLGALALVSLALIASAAHGWATLSRLRQEFLRGRALDIAAAVDQATRGPARRHDPAVWQAVLEQALAERHDSVRFLALVDGTGRPLARAGDPADRRAVIPVPIALRPHGGPGPHEEPAEWRLEVGMNVAAAGFIDRQIRAQLLVTALAVATLAGLGLYLARTTRAYLALRAREESDRHLAALGRMAATLAHEIRNPLGAMKGLSQVAREELPAGHEAEPHLRTLEREAGRLERLVGDLLGFARRRPPATSRLDLAPLLAESIALAQPRAAAAGVRIEPAAVEPIEIHSDPDGLRQVLLNVLHNAIDASPPGGPVEVGAIPAPGGGAVIAVEDRGPGIGDGDPEELFEPFVTHRLHGSGLGLAVSRRILEQIGGSIALANRPGGGARCTILLPAAAAAASDGGKGRA